MGNSEDDKKFEILGPLYAKIGRQIFEDIGEDPNGVFVYTEAGDGWTEVSIFKDKGSFVEYFEGSHELFDLVAKARKVEPKAKRWTVMMYELNDYRLAPVGSVGG